MAQKIPGIDTSNPFTGSMLFILREQHEKMREEFDMGMGWEKWAQAELGLEMERTVDRLRGGGMELYPFQREVPVYDGLNAAAHRGAEVSDQEGVDSELCREAGRGVRKVFYGDWKEEYLSRARFITAWVFAITVTEILARDDEFHRAMLSKMDYIGASHWKPGVSNISPDGAMKLWAWSVTEDVPGF